MHPTFVALWYATLKKRQPWFHDMKWNKTLAEKVPRTVHSRRISAYLVGFMDGRFPKSPLYKKNLTIQSFIPHMDTCTRLQQRSRKEKRSYLRSWGSYNLEVWSTPNSRSILSAVLMEPWKLQFCFNENKALSSHFNVAFRHGVRSANALFHHGVLVIYLFSCR